MEEESKENLIENESRLSQTDGRSKQGINCTLEKEKKLETK